jgi:diguanylate cyclase (GGDEF)-like protein
MRFLGSSPDQIWRQRVVGGLGAFGLYVVLYFFGVLRFGPLEFGAQLIGFIGYTVALFAPPKSWFRWALAIWDAFVLMLLMRSNGLSESVFVVMIPVWFFGVALANLVEGETTPIPWMLSLALLAGLLGGLGGEGFLLYSITFIAAIAAMGAAAFTLTSERRAGRTDPLLPMVLNRSAGLERLEQMGKELDAFTLAFVDLGEFKLVNDRHGHKVGDEVLLEIGRRLRRGVQSGDVVARYGGDEFLVAVRAPATLDRLQAELEPPIQTSAGALTVRSDIGNVPFARGEDLDAVLERADAAMYRRKQAAKRLLPA